jgi:hypothetical protein
VILVTSSREMRLQGARPVQAFLTVRKRPKRVFQAQMLIAGFG